MKYILAIDQGTTGTTAAIMDLNSLSFLGHVNKEYPQIYPHPGEVEHNLHDIWGTVKFTVTEVLKKLNVNAKDIAAIGITNQRETTCAFDSKGNPLANAIVWQDRRTSKFCEILKKSGHEAKVKEITGLTLDPYFSSTKMHWLLNNNDNVKKASKQDLKFGNIDTFLIFKLSGNKSHVTDATNASRTMLMDLKTSMWSKELMQLFNIDQNFLPEIKDCFGKFATTSGLDFLPDGIPITGAIGDQQSALLGQAGIQEGDAKCTYGTGAFMLMNTGDNIITSKHGLLTSVGLRYKGKSSYILEGSCYIAGAAVQWIRDNMNFVSDSAEIEALANRVNSLDELKYLLFFPFFTGIGTPYWKAEAKAAVVGMTRDTKKEHIAFATLEGMVLSINELINAFKADTKLNLSELRVDGGAVRNNLLMELQATYSNLKIIRPKINETTVYGAALAAGIGVDAIKFSDLKKTWKMEREVLPRSDFKNYCLEKNKLWDLFLKRLYL